MFPEGDFRVDAAEGDVLAVVLTGPGGVIQLIVLVYQRLAASGVLPYPILKGVLDGLLLLLGQRRFRLVEDAALLSVLIHHGIVDAHIPEV